MSTNIDIDNKAIQPYELEIFGISAEDVLLREYSATTLHAAVIAMRNIVKLRYNHSTNQRKF